MFDFLESMYNSDNAFVRAVPIFGAIVLAVVVLVVSLALLMLSVHFGGFVGLAFMALLFAYFLSVIMAKI